MLVAPLSFDLSLRQSCQSCINAVNGLWRRALSLISLIYHPFWITSSTPLPLSLSFFTLLDLKGNAPVAFYCSSLYIDSLIFSVIFCVFLSPQDSTTFNIFFLRKHSICKVLCWTYEWILLVKITFSYGLIILYMNTSDTNPKLAMAMLYIYWKNKQKWKWKWNFPIFSHIFSSLYFLS